MNFSQRVLLLMVLIVATSCSWIAEAGGPQPISTRYDDFRERMLRQRLAKQAAYDKREPAFSIPEIDVSISEGGSIVGQGIAASEEALQICGGNLDGILRSFNGIGGGGSALTANSASVGDKTLAIMDRMAHGGSAIYDTLKKMLERHREKKAAINELLDSEVEMDESARTALTQVRDGLEMRLDNLSNGVRICLKENARFKAAIVKLADHKNGVTKAAGQLSLLFTNMNHFAKLTKEFTAVDDRDTIEHLRNNPSLAHSSEWANVLRVYGGSNTRKEGNVAAARVGHHHGGSVTANVSNLAGRLSKARADLVYTINQFVAEFGVNMSALVKAAERLALTFGKTVALDEAADTFLHAFKRMNEFTNNKDGLYKHLLVLNPDEVSSAEIRQRFLAAFKDLGSRAGGLGGGGAAEEAAEFSQACEAICATVEQFGDRVKSVRESTRVDGGSTASMNELYGLSSSHQVNIAGMNNAIEELKILLKKIQFFRNIAAFRNNLRQTTDELVEYTKDYRGTVGEAIGQDITKIRREQAEMEAQIDDDASGLGLEINMYNSSVQKGAEKINKDKLKEMLKWQSDARAGLYKALEAIDLALLHFTETISGNPDAVADLHKMLTATRIIAKWYDQKAGENIVKMFESIAHDDKTLDASDFIAKYQAAALPPRCRRTARGCVLVLKNIISYFVVLGEKYGHKSEKNVIMAPSNIYKNLVNYVWASALNMQSTGTEYMTDGNKMKRLMTYNETAVSFKPHPDFSPETIGLNVGPHSLDKIRILKLQNELSHLKTSVGTLDPKDQMKTASDWAEIKQFVLGCFTRLKGTRYLHHMAAFGVYDLTYMNSKEEIDDFIKFLESRRSQKNLVK
ncbi:hypothetical protein JG688_00013160, partial [Phytophthora aleatoria]